MTAAIRKHDKRHLITVGMIWVTTLNPELWAGFPPREIAPEVDFLAVHVYPEKGKVNVAIDSLRRYQVGKPIVVEETFPMNCSPAEWRDFLELSRGIAQGWLGHYWSLSPQDLEGLEGRGPRTAARTVRGHAASESESLSPPDLSGTVQRGPRTSSRANRSKRLRLSRRSEPPRFSID